MRNVFGVSCYPNYLLAMCLLKESQIHFGYCCSLERAIHFPVLGLHACNNHYVTPSHQGLTLTAAHHVVFAELHYTPGVIIQAEDRAHRIGQTLPVNVHYLIARGTVDEILWGMIRRKVHVKRLLIYVVCAIICITGLGT